MTDERRARLWAEIDRLEAEIAEDLTWAVPVCGCHEVDCDDCEIAQDAESNVFALRQQLKELYDQFPEVRYWPTTRLF